MCKSELLHKCYIIRSDDLVCGWLFSYVPLFWWGTFNWNSLWGWFEINLSVVLYKFPRGMYWGLSHVKTKISFICSKNSLFSPWIYPNNIDLLLSRAVQFMLLFIILVFSYLAICPVWNLSILTSKCTVRLFKMHNIGIYVTWVLVNSISQKL